MAQRGLTSRCQLLLQNAHPLKQPVDSQTVEPGLPGMQAATLYPENPAQTLPRDRPSLFSHRETIGTLRDLLMHQMIPIITPDGCLWKRQQLQCLPASQRLTLYQFGTQQLPIGTVTTHYGI
jgi:hypothetical protein